MIQARTSAGWIVPRGFAPLGDGLGATYARGRRGLRRAEQLPTNHRFHEWRKAVKYLWYQTRLLHDAAPSVLGPLVDQLDGLADALGDDHDLAVLVDLLDTDPDRFGTPESVEHVRQLATLQQDELRIAAYRSGATIYAEPTSAFRRRIRSYWRLAVHEGPECPTGGIATLAAARSDRPGGPAADDTDAAVTVERERKFLIDAIPTDLDLSDRVEIRQGYLVADDSASVRVRDAGHHGRTLTVKAGRGAERTELEWAIGNDQFEAAWPHTVGRRVVKTRHRIPHGTHLIELDVFAEDLDGLVFAEVEFDSVESLAEFEPPAWFGREVTDDGRYTNASLSLHGRPVEERFARPHRSSVGRMKLLVTLVVGALMLGACSSDDDAENDGTSVGGDEPVATSATDTAVTGNVTIAADAPAVTFLPSSAATLSVTLQDVSVADAPAMVLSSQTIELTDQEFPIPFELPYELGSIVENHTYSVAARVESGGDLVMISDTMTPVITNNAPTSDVDVVLISIADN